MKPIRKAVFPVAGLGTRFLPATKAMPKEMLTVVDRPLIQHVVDEAREAGHRAFHLRHRTQQGRDRGPFRPAIRAGADAARARQEGRAAVLAEALPAAGATSFTRQQAPLGLGHAVWCARELVGDEPFAVLLPDMLVQAKQSCLAQMIDAYRGARRGREHHRGRGSAAGSDVIMYGVVGVGKRKGKAFAHHRHGGEAAARQGAVESHHHGPLHPAAGNLRHPGKSADAARAARSSSPTR